MMAYAMQVHAVLLVLEGHLVLQGLVGFKGVEVLVEPEDHELLEVLGLEDLLDMPLYFSLDICFLLSINYLIYISSFVTFPLPIIKIGIPFSSFYFNINVTQ